MSTLRKSLAAALAASTLGLAALAMSSPAEAHGFGERHGEFGHHWGGGYHPGCFVFGASCGHGPIWRGPIWGAGGGYRWNHWGWGHRWAYGYGAPIIAYEPRVCPREMHLSYSGRFCVPNF